MSILHANINKKNVISLVNLWTGPGEHIPDWSDFC